MIIDLVEAPVMPIFLEAMVLHLAGVMDAESRNSKLRSLVRKVHFGVNIWSMAAVTCFWDSMPRLFLF